MYSSRNTKIHAVVDALGNPIHVQLSSGDIHDSGITEDVLDHVELEPNGTAVLADKAGQEGICRMRFRPVTEVWNRFTKSEEYSAESGSLVIHAAGEPLLMKTSWKPCNIKEVSAGGKTLNIRSNSNEILFIMDHGITEYWADDGLRYGAVEVDEKALSGQISLGTGICKAEVYRFHK